MLLLVWGCFFLVLLLLLFFPQKETVDANAFPKALFFQKYCGFEERWKERQFSLTEIWVR